VPEANLLTRGGGRCEFLKKSGFAYYAVSKNFIHTDDHKRTEEKNKGFRKRKRMVRALREGRKRKMHVCII
jgi:hypothetical protein